MPVWAARLPKDVGYPAGGTLTSDEWKCLMLIYGPLVVRKIFYLEFLSVLTMGYVDSTHLG